MLCNIRRKEGLESQHQCLGSEINNSDAEKKIPARIITSSLGEGRTIFLPKPLLPLLDRGITGLFVVVFLHLLFSSNMKDNFPLTLVSGKVGSKIYSHQVFLERSQRSIVSCQALNVQVQSLYSYPGFHISQLHQVYLIVLKSHLLL